MSIEINTLDSDDRERWNELVERAPSASLFHHYDVLEVIERHASARLHPLVGYKGQEPVGVFPIFEIRRAGIGTAFSPPPGLGILSLGPLHLNEQKLKQRKLEKRRKRFVEGCLEWVDEEVSPRYSRFSTPIEYGDVRPFSWNDFDATPLYTYFLDIDRPEEELKRSFSKSLRRYLDPDDPERYDISTLGTDGIRFIYEQTRARYEAQDKRLRVPLDYVIDLFETVPNGRIHPYVATVDGERASGILVLEGQSTIYYSIGGGKPDIEYPINDLLHWRIIRDARERGAETYDLHGADSPRISEYKAKFNPELRAYYDLERGSLDMKLVSQLYKSFI